MTPHFLSGQDHTTKGYNSVVVCLQPGRSRAGTRKERREECRIFYTAAKDRGVKAITNLTELGDLRLCTYKTLVLK